MAREQLFSLSPTSFAFGMPSFPKEGRLEAAGVEPQGEPESPSVLEGIRARQGWTMGSCRPRALLPVGFGLAPVFSCLLCHWGLWVASPILSLGSDPGMPQPSSSSGSWPRGCIPRDEPCDGKGLPHYTQRRNLWHKLSVEGPRKVPFWGTSLGQLSPMTHSMGETKAQPRGPQGCRTQAAWDWSSTHRRASSPHNLRGAHHRSGMAPWV